jgi:hypothetical protein
MQQMNTAIIKPQWSPFTIALMVLGFIVFWPLGFVVLAYILWGERFSNGGGFRPDRWMQEKQQRWARHSGGYAFSSGNAAFDAYREEQLKRLDEERRKLDDEIEAFREHMRNLRMARDREEFDRFMRERNASRQGYTEQGNQGNQGDQQGGGY